MNWPAMHTPQILLLSLFLAVPAASNVNAAEIAPSAGCSGLKCFRISGEITRMDVAKVNRILDSLGIEGSKNSMFYIDSSGGDVLAAIDIGRLIRKSHAMVGVVGKDKCYSACVFILAGATRRVVGGAVGIHRPYSTDIGALDFTEVQRRYRDLDGKAREFLKEVNMPDSLFEAMVRIPSEHLRILNEEELAAFGLNQIDPVEQEIMDNAGAQTYGLTKIEYLSLKLKVDAVCNAYLQANDKYISYTRCREQIFRKQR